MFLDNKVKNNINKSNKKSGLLLPPQEAFILTNFGRKVEIIKKNKVTRQTDVLEKGYFNEWVKTENFVMVIIELEDGTIQVEHSSNVRFVDKIKS